MKKITVLIVLLGLTIGSIYAQQALFRETPILSPEIHQDRTVTFRLSAPNAATVAISGGWMSSEGATRPSVLMKKGGDGI